MPPTFTVDLIDRLAADDPAALTQARLAASHVLRHANLPEDVHADAVAELVEQMGHTPADITPQAHARRLARAITRRAAGASAPQRAADLELVATVTRVARRRAMQSGVDGDDVVQHTAADVLSHIRQGRPVQDMTGLAYSIAGRAVGNLRTVNASRGQGSYRDAVAGDLGRWRRLAVENAGERHLYVDLDELESAELSALEGEVVRVGKAEGTQPEVEAPQWVELRAEIAADVAAHFGWTLIMAARAVHVFTQDALVQVERGHGLAAELHRMGKTLSRDSHAETYAAASHLPVPQWRRVVRFLCGEPSRPPQCAISAAEAAARGVSERAALPARPARPAHLVKVLGRRATPTNPVTNVVALERAA